MHENDFDKDIKAALDDIVNTAPKPPKWKWITSGYAPLRREEPQPWYRRGGAAFLGAAAAAVVVVGVAGFIGSGLSGDDAGDESEQSTPISDSGAAQSLTGRWVLVSYEVDDEVIAVQQGENTPEQPWIEFHETASNDSSDSPESTGTFTGSTGCNKINHGFTVGYEYSAGFLVLEEAITEAAYCDYPVEDIFMAVLWGSRDGIEVVLGSDTMELYGSNLTGETFPLTFRRDAGDTKAKDGLRPGADLEGAIATWVNDLGLNQQQTDVWSDRFVEVCATNSGELAPLAEKYIAEDASLSTREGGELPSVDEATDTLGTIWRMTCAASSFEEPPADSPTGAQASCGLGGQNPFDVRYTEGPELSPDEFLATPQGEILEAFFNGGPGEVEGSFYLQADGFSIVSGEFVLSYQGGELLGDFRIRDGEIAGWGSCSPVLQASDLTAQRWSVRGPLDLEMKNIPINVQGGTCGDFVTTEVIGIDVDERSDSVLVTVWTKENWPPEAEGNDNYVCAGVGINLEAMIGLSEPLGDRTLLNAGTVPPSTVEVHERREPDSNDQCSTAGMAGVEFKDYAPSWEELPSAVADTRDRLLNAAMACDLEQIIAIANDGATGDGNDSIFWGATQSLDELAQYDAEYGALRQLVLTLTTLPWQAIEAETYDAENEVIIPQTYYTWPPVTQEFEGDTGLADQWSLDLLERVAAVNEQTIAELIAQSSEVGAYWGFRASINEDGTWLFALDGD